MSEAGLELRAVPALASGQADSIGAILAGMDPWLTLGYSAQALARTLNADHPDLMRYLAVRDGEILGLALVRHPWLRGAYIELFAVLPQAQGRGVGRALLRFVETSYRGRTGNLWLLVSAFNVGARGFYTRHGFASIGTIPNLVMVGRDEILMRKVIGSGTEQP